MLRQGGACQNTGSSGYPGVCVGKKEIMLTAGS